jgi:uncharacterized protein with PQ loop repeat
MLNKNKLTAAIYLAMFMVYYFGFPALVMWGYLMISMVHWR